MAGVDDAAPVVAAYAIAVGTCSTVEQLIAMVAEGGDAEHVPPTIGALVAARLDSLPAAERSLLERAAVIGLEFGWDDLTELTQDRRRPAVPCSRRSCARS